MKVKTQCSSRYFDTTLAKPAMVVCGCVEEFGIPKQYVDSGSWSRECSVCGNLITKEDVINVTC